MNIRVSGGMNGNNGKAWKIKYGRRIGRGDRNDSVGRKDRRFERIEDSKCCSGIYRYRVYNITESMQQQELTNCLSEKNTQHSTASYQ